MTNVIVHEWGYINTNQGRSSAEVLSHSIFSWSTFQPSCIWWLFQWDWNSQVQPQLASEGFTTWESREFSKKKVILHKSFISPSFPRCQLCVWVVALLPVLCLFHCGGVSPTISMPCCWSCALSKAFSFFSSSILRTKSKKKISL